MGCDEMLIAIERLLDEKERMIIRDIKAASVSVEYDNEEMNAELSDIKRFKSFINTNRGSLLSYCRDLQQRDSDNELREIQAKNKKARFSLGWF
jgi:hypothetical protein